MSLIRKNSKWIGLLLLFIFGQIAPALVPWVTTFCLCMLLSLLYLTNAQLTETGFLFRNTLKSKHLQLWVACNVLLFALTGLILWLGKLPVEYFSNWFLVVLIPYGIAIHTLRAAAAGE